MPQENLERPVSPELKRLQTADQAGTRSILRSIGPLVFIAGLICTIGGIISFFSSFGSFEPPHYFWLCFVGMPLMFVGGVMSQFGFIGAAARYVAGETAPVATDIINYVADETKGAVLTVARSATTGILEGRAAGKPAAEANFCPHCGFATRSDYEFCPKCGKAQPADDQHA